jgi:hypothetical protein
MSKEIASLEEFARKQQIEGITLDTKSTLIDLLRVRILDSSQEWKAHMDTLVNIPASEKGDVLRGGDYFEAVFQLAIAIGILPQFQNAKVVFHDVVKYKDVRPFENYLYTKTVKNSGGNEQGISDITFELTPMDGSTFIGEQYKCGELPTKEKTKNPFYFISVKGFKREKNAAKDYDVPLLGEQLREFTTIENKHVVVCVRNKEQFMKRLGRSRMEFIKNSIDHVIGYDEVMQLFSTFRTNFFLKHSIITPDVIAKEVALMFPEKEMYKHSLSLYFHQELIVKTAIQRIGENPDPRNPHFLCIGVLPRGGKSYIAGGIIDAHRKLKARDTYNVLFLTSAVNETREQFKEDLIDKFSEFKDFQFVDIVNAGKKKVIPKKYNFVFVSRQLSSMTGEKEGDEKSIILETQDLVSRIRKVMKEEISFDICFFDEAHIGIIAASVREQFKRTFEQFRMPIVLMSATYKKPAIVLEDPRDLFVWDLRDIKDMKDLPSLRLSGFLEKAPEVLQRYPSVAQEILQRRLQLGQTEEDIARPYLQFPSPNFISLTFAPEDIKYLKDTGFGYEYISAFTIGSNPKLLGNNEMYNDWGSLLTNREQALRIRQFLTPEQDAKDEFLAGKQRKYRAFNQIFSIAQRTGSRPLIGKPFSVLMFLPFGQGLPIGELCRIWGSFLLESRYWKSNFVILTLSTYAKHVRDPKMTVERAVERGLCHREDFSTSLKDTIRDIEREALKYGKGLVLLSGDVAKMGISLKCVDVVCLMSNNKDADDIIQKMYRALTDDPPMKKNGFIIDLNLTRVVQAMFEYDMEKSRRTMSEKTIEPKERLNKLMELCNWGQDGFMIDNPDMTFDDVMNTIRDKVFSNIEERIRNDYGSRDLVDKQFSIIQNTPGLLDNVVSVLRFTTGKRSKGKKETLLERGSDIPKEEDIDEYVEEEKVKEKTVRKIEPLTIEQIKKKIIDIMITFVNALVIKSGEPWKDMTFQKLINKYKLDKSSATRVCDCDVTQECNTSFSNLYDTVYCELRGYAMLETGKDQNGYNSETHERIMTLMDTLFDKSSSLSPDWTNYITSLIQDIYKQKPLAKGGDRRKTIRNKTALVNKNDRSTRRNNTRYH